MMRPLFWRIIITKRKVTGMEIHLFLHIFKSNQAYPARTPTLKVIKALIEEKQSLNSILVLIYLADQREWMAQRWKELLNRGYYINEFWWSVSLHSNILGLNLSFFSIGKFVNDGESNTGSLAASITTKKGYYASYKFNIPSNEIIK